MNPWLKEKKWEEDKKIFSSTCFRFFSYDFVWFIILTKLGKAFSASVGCTTQTPLSYGVSRVALRWLLYRFSSWLDGFKNWPDFKKLKLLITLYLKVLEAFWYHFWTLTIFHIFAPEITFFRMEFYENFNNFPGGSDAFLTINFLSRFSYRYAVFICWILKL